MSHKFNIEVLFFNFMKFAEQCYEVLRKVPSGKVTTYKEIAHALNSKAYRAVGTAMNKNPYSFIDGGKIPCHRVINSDGKVGGFAKGSKKKIEMLRKERVEIFGGTPQAYTQEVREPLRGPEKFSKKISTKDKIDLKKYLYKFGKN
jgi:methylated-DNA-[protein]-cysteine S-methyltransferase